MPIAAVVLGLAWLLPGELPWGAGVVLVILTFLAVALHGWALGRSYQLMISEAGIRLRGGVLRRARSSSPAEVPQAARCSAGPIAQIFGVRGLHVRTASRTSHLAIPALDQDDCFRAMSLISVITARWSNPIDLDSADHGLDDAAPEEPTLENRAETGVEWRRFHPLSPFIRAFVLIIAILLAAAGFNYLWTLNALTWLGADEQRSWWGPMLWAGIVLSVLLAAGFVLHWYFHRFAVDDQRLYLRSGALIRHHRSVLLERVQSIDLEQPEYLRPFGLVALTLHVAEQDTTTARLRFLNRPEAERLRQQFLRNVGRTAADTERQDSEDSVTEEHDASATGDFILPGRRIAAAMTWSWGTLILLGALFMATLSNGLALVFALLAPQAGTVEDFRGIIAHPLLIIPLVIAALSAYWGLLKRTYRYRARVEGSRVIVQAELIQRIHYTIPLKRLQSIRISQPPIYRPFGWYKVSVVVAGYGFADQDKTQIIPAGSLDEVIGFCRELLLAGLDLDVTARELRIGLLGEGPETGYTVIPWRGQWRKPWTGRRAGFRLDHQTLLMRDGALVPRVTVVPRTKMQSVTCNQGIIFRALNLWTVQAHLTDGTYSARVTAQPTEPARELLKTFDRHPHLADSPPAG